MINGHASSDFANEYVTLIKRAERFSPDAYFNQGDVPTIGFGFAFITVSTGVYTDRSVASLNGFFAGIHTFSTADGTTLNDIAADLTNGNYTAARAKFDAWPFATGVTLTEPEATTLLINVATDIAQRVIDQDIREGLADTRELAVLYSLAYNGESLIGDNLVGAIRNNNRPEAWYEIRYGSNGGDPAFQHGRV
jgi:GH24 family phage-related lysozyme (muramidase)